ncbi:unnamed protein product [Durusdinium trenchii]|uniref:ATP-grasp domain-containing protein n=1 Tax=Durusdinium trenchii TaxID=1381693 RepID=A0ABP0KCH8_9DINO
MATMPVALMPEDPEFDEEAQATHSSGWAVQRLRFAHEAQLSPGFDAPPAPTRAVFRGFMLSRQRRAFLHESLMAQGLELVVSPSQYSNAHFFPSTYDALRALAPRATWQPVDLSSEPRAELFQEAVAVVQSWNCRYVVLKDYVKSAKAQGSRFLQVPVDEDLAEVAMDFVRARGERFNEGVVFKEYVELMRYAGRAGYTTNEWRLWFMCQQLVKVAANSFQEEADEPPKEVLEQVTEMAQSIDSPYFTIDLAETSTGWTILEAGDGSVSGLGVYEDPAEHWQLLAAHFGEDAA